MVAEGRLVGKNSCRDRITSNTQTQNANKGQIEDCGADEKDALQDKKQQGLQKCRRCSRGTP